MPCYNKADEARKRNLDVRTEYTTSLVEFAFEGYDVNAGLRKNHLGRPFESRPHDRGFLIPSPIHDS